MYRQGQCWKPELCPISSLSTAKRAAPVRRRWSLRTTLECRWVEGLTFVHNALRGAALRDQVSVGAAGKLITAFDIAHTLSLGADWVNSARGFMFALGCIQAQACHTNRRTPQELRRRTGCASGRWWCQSRRRGWTRFHRNMMKALAEMVGAAGLTHPSEFLPRHFVDAKWRR